ncbi:MAG: hypothetical protein EOM25_05130 [Deltaproteobacteria bacterium]|nr:hypothetical protein [Deltaproteobacteria bacterium]
MKTFYFLILWVLFFLIVNGTVAAQNATAPAAGDGSQDNPYQISSLENLYWIAADSSRWAAHYIQTADIDASSTSTWPGGGWSSIGNSVTNFIGIYDGNGYVISNTFISRINSNYQGLFGYVASATIRNLILRDVDISGANNVGSFAGSIINTTLSDCFATGVVNGSENVGGLVGRMVANDVLTDSHADVAVNGDRSVGGLVGSMGNDGEMVNCSAVGPATGGEIVGGLVGSVGTGMVHACHAAGIVSGIDAVGGLAGSCLADPLSDSYATGAVTGTGRLVGGLLGLNAGTVTNTYAVGPVSGDEHVGGLVGFSWNGVVNNSFWDSDAGGPNNGIGTGKTTTDMKTQSTFTDVGWNFSDIWGMAGNINSGYPYLSRTPAVTTQDVTGISRNSAIVHGAVIDLGVPSLTSHGVCWNRSGVPDINDHCLDLGAAPVTGEFTADVTGLNSSTIYFVRAFAVNEAGINYGRQIVFSTSAPVNAPEVTTQDVSDITATTASGHGDIISLGTPDPTSHGVCWSTTIYPSTEDFCTDNGPTSSTGVFTANITGLSSGTTYYLRAYVANTAGTGYGRQVRFTTEDVLPTVITLPVTDIAGTSVTGWGEIKDLGAPHPTAHGLCWNTTGTPGIEDDCQDLGPADATGVFTTNISGLSTGETYYVRAFASSGFGTSYGREISFVTGGPTVSTGNATHISATTAKGHGEITILGLSNATAHGMCWATDPDPGVWRNCANNGPSTNTGPFTVDMVGLIPGTTYYAQAYATNSAGTNYGQRISFTTNSSLGAPVITTLNATQISAATAMGHGSIISPGASDVTAHGVCWATTPNPGVAGYCNNKGSAANPGDFIADIIELTPDTTYYVQAFASNTEGTNYGNQVEFTTNQASIIRYDGNNSTSGSAPDDQTKTPEETLTLRTNSGNLARTGYAFAGWNTASDGSGTDYAEGSEYAADASLTLYAKWL